MLGGMVRTAQRDGLWDVVLPVTETMSQEGLRRLAGLPALHAPNVLAAIADAAVASGLLADLMPLTDWSPIDGSAVFYIALIGPPGAEEGSPSGLIGQTDSVVEPLTRRFREGRIGCCRRERRRGVRSSG